MGGPGVFVGPSSTAIGQQYASTVLNIALLALKWIGLLTRIKWSTWFKHVIKISLNKNQSQESRLRASARHSFITRPGGRLTHSLKMRKNWSVCGRKFGDDTWPPLYPHSIQQLSSVIYNQQLLQQKLCLYFCSAMNEWHRCTRALPVISQTCVSVDVVQGGGIWPWRAASPETINFR